MVRLTMDRATQVVVLRQLYTYPQRYRIQSGEDFGRLAGVVLGDEASEEDANLIDVARADAHYLREMSTRGQEPIVLEHKEPW